MPYHNLKFIYTSLSVNNFTGLCVINVIAGTIKRAGNVIRVYLNMLISLKISLSDENHINSCSSRLNIIKPNSDRAIAMESISNSSVRISHISLRVEYPNAFFIANSLFLNNIHRCTIKITVAIEKIYIRLAYFLYWGSIDCDSTNL